MDMGLDSLLSVELRTRLQDGLGVSLSRTFAFDSSINDLGDLLLERMALADLSESALPSTGSDDEDDLEEFKL